MRYILFTGDIYYPDGGCLDIDSVHVDIDSLRDRVRFILSEKCIDLYDKEYNKFDIETIFINVYDILENKKYFIGELIYGFSYDEDDLFELNLFD